MKKIKILVMVILAFVITLSSMPVASAYSSYAFVNNDSPSDSSSSFGYVTGKGKPASIQLVTDGKAVIYVNTFLGGIVHIPSARGDSYVYTAYGAGSFNLAYPMKLGEDYQIQVRKLSGSYAKAYVNSDW